MPNDAALRISWEVATQSTPTEEAPPANGNSLILMDRFSNP